MPITATKRKITITLGAGVVLVAAAGALAIASVRRLAAHGEPPTVTTAVVLLLVALSLALAFLARHSIARDLERRTVGERALRAAEQRFHAIFDQAFQYTLLLAPTGEIVEANETALGFFGARDALVGRPLWELPAWSERGREIVRAAVVDAAGGAFVRLEEEARGGDGQGVCTFDISLKSMHHVADGATVIVEARDVTERKEADEALRASEAKFSGILGIAADAIITIDDEQRIVHFNHGAEEIFGYAAVEMIGRPLDPLLPLAARAGHHEHVERFGRAPETARRMGARREVSGRRKNGEEFPAEASISKLESGGRLLFTVVLRDVTERKRAEDRQRFLAQAGTVLAASLDYRQTLAEVSRLALPTLGDACILDIDVAGGTNEVTVAHVDPTKEAAYREMRRRFPIPYEGSHPLAVVRRTGRPMLLPVLDDARLARLALNEEHGRTLRALGVRSEMFVPLTAREHTLGVLSYYTEGPRSFTEDDLALASELARRAALAIDTARLYEAARLASAARDEVLAIVSHDLRNPLSTIGMCAGALLDPEPASAEGVRSMAETIQLAADWAQRIIRDLLDVTSIEAGRLALDKSALPVTVVLESARGVMQMQAEQAGVELVVSADGAPPAIDADPERVLQVLLNLIGNALKFTPPGGRVTLSASLDGTLPAPAPERVPAVRFSVTDTGSGIAPDHLPNVFDRYWQLRATGRAGAGLGLAIARGIVEAHGGEIAVTSTVGAGTTFAFTIPVARARPVAAGASPRMRDPSSSPRPTHGQ